MSPDWSSKEDPVPYAKLDDPQSLNLYAYVGNNPLKTVDKDGHEGPPLPDNIVESIASDLSSPYAQGGAQMLVGGGLVATAMAGDVPGGITGGLILADAALGGTVTTMMGATTVVGAATNTDVTQVQEVLGATQNLPGLATTAASGGNLRAGEVASTVGNAASLATDPKGAVKNAATAVDAAQTVKETAGLISQSVSALKSGVSGTTPPPPPPAAPPRPSCSVAGAC